MSNFIVPNTFVPGTKARAQDVNENFSSVQDELNTKAYKAGDASIAFSVGNATEDNHAVNKNQFETTLEDKISEAGDEIYEEIEHITPSFLIESGNTNNTGEPDIISFSGSDGIVSFKIGDGTIYAPLTAVSANSGSKFTLTSVASVNVSSYANGTYNTYISPDGNAYIYNSAIIYQKYPPAAPYLNNIFIDTSSMPLKVQRYNGTEWEEFNDVHLGTVTVTNGVVTACTHRAFNDNGINVNRINHIVIEEAYANGDSWYRVWSDGWCEQGGTVNFSGTAVSAVFLKSYKNNNYSITTSFLTNNDTQRNCYVTNRGLYNIKIGGYTNTSIAVYWTTSGYIK